MLNKDHYFSNKQNHIYRTNFDICLSRLWFQLSLQSDTFFITRFKRRVSPMEQELRFRRFGITQVHHCSVLSYLWVSLHICSILSNLGFIPNRRKRSSCSIGDTRCLNLVMKNVSDCRLNWNHNLDIDVRTVVILLSSSQLTLADF
jgi:hypothetical protein